MKLATLGVVLALSLAGCAGNGQQSAAGTLPGGWIGLFNGRNLDGWRISEDTAAFHVVNGVIAADGRRSHLFYEGPVMNHDFRNFELKADVMTTPGANSAIYVHTHFLEGAWPNTLPSGYEVQINNTEHDPKRTGSLYGFSDVLTAMPDNEWFTMHVVTSGRRVQVFLNDRQVTDYTEPADKPSRLTGGTIALQAHIKGEKTYFRNVMVRALP
jgi:hypothetical protein